MDLDEVDEIVEHQLKEKQLEDYQMMKERERLRSVARKSFLKGSQLSSK